MVYQYLRYSTGKQDERQQENTIINYCHSHNIPLPEVTYMDQATSGSVSWENRNLAELISVLEPGDTLIVSEISRLSRSISDTFELVDKVFRSKRIRFIICNMNLDIDCSQPSSFVVQTMVFMFSCAAQMEREFIMQRCKSSAQVRQHLIKTQGGFVSKSGNWCTKPTGNTKIDVARAISASNRAKKTLMVDKAIFGLLITMKDNGLVLDEMAHVLNNLGYKNARGRKFNKNNVARLIHGKAKEEIGIL
jgi:DNA invertase Pin-like site-specific DNA recombinase